MPTVFEGPLTEPNYKNWWWRQWKDTLTEEFVNEFQQKHKQININELHEKSKYLIVSMDGTIKLVGSLRKILQSDTPPVDEMNKAEELGSQINKILTFSVYDLNDPLAASWLESGAEGRPSWLNLMSSGPQGSVIPAPMSVYVSMKLNPATWISANTFSQMHSASGLKIYSLEAIQAGITKNYREELSKNAGLAEIPEGPLRDILEFLGGRSTRRRRGKSRRRRGKSRRRIGKSKRRRGKSKRRRGKSRQKK
jgi:hypothetical protein